MVLSARYLEEYYFSVETMPRGTDAERWWGTR